MKVVRQKLSHFVRFMGQKREKCDTEGTEYVNRK